MLLFTEGLVFHEPSMNTLNNTKLNPQARYSAVAEAVALDDAEVKGRTFDMQIEIQNPPILRRKTNSNRPLSNIIVDSMECNTSNPSNSTQPIQTLPKRKPRPASMALIAPIDTQPQCFYCMEEAAHLCNWCRVAYYCGPSHYNIHRCHSKCWPFKVKG